MELYATNSCRGICSIFDVFVSSVLLAALATLTIFDIRSMRLPNAITLPLLVAGLCVTEIREPSDLTDHVIAAGLGFAVLWILATAYRRFRGHDGLGLGDAKLLAAAGAWLGTVNLPWIMLLAAGGSLAYLLVAAPLHQRADRRTMVPFGPGLALATWVIWMGHIAARI